MSYDQEFAQAMKLKLQRNRQMRSSQNSEASAPQSVPFDRGEEVEKLLAKHPSLTREEAEKGLKEMGF